MSCALHKASHTSFQGDGKVQDATEGITTPSERGRSKATIGNTHTLEEAFGKGQGKHAGTKRRRHSNKYKSNSKATSSLDPWEMQLRAAEEEKDTTQNALERAEMEEIEEGRKRRRAERQERGEELVYPDEEDIDPYDPSTFGYIEV